VDSAGGGPGYDRDGLAAGDQPELAAGRDGDGLACAGHAGLDFRWRPRCHPGRFQKRYALIFI
jgi:hypothetical protein